MVFIKENKIFSLLILIFFLINTFQAIKINSNFNKFDNINNEQHQIIKGESLKYWQRAERSKFKIIEVVDHYRNAYLYPKFLLLVSKIFNFNFYEESGKISLDNKFPLFFTQYLFYICSVILIYNQCKKILSKKINLILCFFLMFDPTINQHHFIIFSESIFFSLLLIVTSLYFKIVLYHNSKKNYINFLLLGFLIGLLFILRSVAIYYILVFIFLIFFLGLRKYLISLIIGYSLIILFIGLNNFYSNKIFKITPTQGGGDVLYGYLATDVYGYANNLSIPEARNLFFKDKIEIFYEINKNKFKSNLNDLSLNDQMLINEYKKKEAIKIFTDYPFETIKILIYHYSKSLLIHPYWVKNFFKETYLGRSDYIENNINLKYETIYRVFYSLFFYLIFFVGFFLSLKRIDKKINLYIFFSAIYFFTVSGFVGNPRYTMPTYIFLIFYFSFGISYLYKYTLEFCNKKKTD